MGFDVNNNKNMPDHFYLLSDNKSNRMLIVMQSIQKLFYFKINIPSVKGIYASMQNNQIRLRLRKKDDHFRFGGNDENHAAMMIYLEKYRI